MRKNKIIRKQQLRYMLFNFVAFSIIFSLFGIIIFTSIQRSLYSQPDEELQAYQNVINDQRGPMDGNFSGRDQRDGPPLDDRPALPSPRVIEIHWNEDGEIINQEQLGTMLYENYLTDLQLDTNQLGSITNLNLNNTYNFRSLTIADDGSTGAYAQLLINVDAEQNMLERFEMLLIVCSVIFVFLSIMASYILSKKTMQPIINSWNKQVEFVENASHELRTPLTIIKNKLELLLTTPNAKIMEKFENIALTLSETNRLSKLTADLLTLARADSETQLEKEIINFDEFIHEVCDPYKEIAQYQQKHVWFQLECFQTLEVDKERIHQLLVILLDNALKYTTENNSIGIKTSFKDNKAILEISDTGIGISKEGLDHIFERFYREDKARSRENGGMGLGLSIAQWIVTSHHGTISAYQNQPKGTILKIKLPIG
ncbi:sensor histidine kinase [Aquibacillus rhizosphaerae]|uniref:histidine kinase n=1 Tax=Aquibacillus rhizosphaerae TaxID=3051431 RepID=A0ABT7L5V0_9BACI|nr:ATP-binding protein [Aquibacillus sp. LR5S19]MDL4841248.1 ATP-binding protein [Aquibacillus sp. LR5S19]